MSGKYGNKELDEFCHRNQLTANYSTPDEPLDGLGYMTTIRMLNTDGREVASESAFGGTKA
ncbi:unnamed protein product, partial [Oppiella nova]